ncbi:MAG: phenylalanine--tRNA ligase subunit alpha [Holosporales bacterium]|nr:phenylalanine--tRNA ligase subunit alpha [Holosporales bacterium]
MVGISASVTALEKNLETWILAIDKCGSTKEIDEIRRNLLGKTGHVTNAFGELKGLSVDDKKLYGDRVNKIKFSLEDAILNVKIKLEKLQMLEKLDKEAVDVTLPVINNRFGKLHIITSEIRRIKQYYQSRGFSVIDGPEVETDFFNFDALNMPKHHPARQNHDTFYIDGFDAVLLRTQTSCVQVRAMLEGKLPIRMVSIGKTYRRDATDATHSPMFHQLEGLVVDRSPLNIGHLKSELVKFISSFFEVDNVAVRLRPSFFPFTEPGMEVDCRYSKKDGKVALSSTGDKWLEISGAGMVHPNVFKYCGIHGEVYGFAYAFGIERIIMLKNGINDIRDLYSSDKRALQYYGRPA